ncbi:MAG: 16S rRNA (guanine(527)-N(7))-methyltransferase RsmG [Robiginitomaculum sp.]|nr:16S rRNA (guanine(527)-N(7))-methyltransferase RsmG [Robiginitomaculum sp.]
MNAEQFQHKTNVSRETLEDLEAWYNLLTRWNKKINLVSSATLHDFWLRHAMDSWQLINLLPEGTKTVLDMGAGAGFPGLALAIGVKNGLKNGLKNELKNKPEVQITLVESNGKKCNFLRTVIRDLTLPAKAVQARAENLEPQMYDIITARAFAPLPKLLDYSLPFWGASSQAIFPKGENWQSEVDAARKTHNFDLTTKDSQTSEAAKILCITNLRKGA